MGGLITHANQPAVQSESISVSPANAGNLLTLAVENKFPGTAPFTAAAVTGGGVGTWHRATSYPTYDSYHGQELWWGTVTSAGPSTLTVAYTAGPTTGASESVTSLDVQELASSSGASTVWSLDRIGKVDTGIASTTA